MTGLDILVLIIVSISALLAFARGFIREILSMTAVILGILAVVWGYPVFKIPVRGMVGQAWLADTITILGLFILVYIAVRVLTGRIHEWIHDSEPLGILDRTAGLLFGVARGVAIVSIGVLLISSITKQDRMPSIITDAKFYPLLALTGDALSHLTPKATSGATKLVKGASDAGNEMSKWSSELNTNELSFDDTNSAEESITNETNTIDDNSLIIKKSK